MRSEKYFPAPTAESFWPPYKYDYYLSDCIRGFLSDSQGEKNGVVSKTKQLADLAKEASRLLQLNAKAGISRVSLQAIVTKQVLKETLKNPSVGNLIEAILPLIGAGDNYDESCLVYLGTSLTQRSGLNRETSRHLAIVQEEPTRPLETMIESIGTEFKLKQVGAQDSHLAPQLANLWGKFGFTYEQTAEMIANPKNIITVVLRNNQVASAGRAELFTLTLNGQPFYFAEQTDAATATEFEGQGLYQAIVASSTISLAKLPTPPHLVLGECNGSSIAPLKIARRLGRKFAADFGSLYGYPFSGILPQDIVMETDGGRVFKDLIPTFLTRADLLRVANVTR